MRLTSKKMFCGNQSYQFEKIDVPQESYWKYTESDYGIEEYDFSDIGQLEKKIEENTGINYETAKCMAVEAFRIYYTDSDRAEKSVNREVDMPEFVYRM